MAVRPPVLDEILRSVARRYRVPSVPDLFPLPESDNPATALAVAIEQARAALARGETPDEISRLAFLEALSLMIRDAMRPEQGDPAFQAMVLQQRAAHVREYASLLARADQDRRVIRSAVNAVAHPAKQARASSDRQAKTMARLHELAFSAAWKKLSDATQQALELADVATDPQLTRGIARIRDEAALDRLERLKELEPDELVQRYLSLRDRNGPRPGSAGAATQGTAARRRGAEVEKLATQALQALARRLEKEEGSPGSYRVAASLRVPAALCNNAERAKGEWDALLLRKVESADEASRRTVQSEKGHATREAWDVLLLVEAKASVDAATTDLPRLLRGLHLLTQAHRDTIYTFESRHEAVRLRGASLSRLKEVEAAIRGKAESKGVGPLQRTVLYFCDAPAEASPRLLSPASRMQLLSTQASLKFAEKLAQGETTRLHDLLPVWQHLLESPKWRAVLHQYQALHQVRELMVHADDLMAAIKA